MSFKGLVDMTRSAAEKAAEHERYSTGADHGLDMPDVPPGLCICLTEAELDKLDLEHDAEVGDLIELRVMAKVTSVSKHDSGSGPRCRIELSITHMECEDEEEEEEGE